MAEDAFNTGTANGHDVSHEYQLDENGESGVPDLPAVGNPTDLFGVGVSQQQHLDVSGDVPLGSTIAARVAAKLLEEMPDLDESVRPSKKRKKQEEFTVAQRLAILDELDAPDPPTVVTLADKYNTTKTSIYRWRQDRKRLDKLARSEGKGQYKRAVLRRKLYNAEFTAAEKLAVIREFKTQTISVKDLARKNGTHDRSIYRWIKDEAKFIKLVEEEGMGHVKRDSGDHLGRIKNAIQIFYHSNLASEQPVRITGTVIAAKAKQAKDELLGEHAMRPFLNDDEVKSMTEFTCSSSWGRKIARNYGWKGATSNDSSSEKDPGRTGDGPRKKISNEQKAKLQRKVDAMKSEIASLKKRAKVAEDRASQLEKDNAELQRQVIEIKLSSYEHVEMPPMQHPLEQSQPQPQPLDEAIEKIV